MEIIKENQLSKILFLNRKTNKPMSSKGKSEIASNKKPQMSPIGRRDLEDRKNYVSS